MDVLTLKVCDRINFLKFEWKLVSVMSASRADIFWGYFIKLLKKCEPNWSKLEIFGFLTSPIRTFSPSCLQKYVICQMSLSFHFFQESVLSFQWWKYFDILHCYFLKNMETILKSTKQREQNLYCLVELEGEIYSYNTS